MFKKINLHLNTDLVKRIKNGAFWSFTGTTISKAIVLIAGILCARILGQEEYGEFGMVRSTINMFVLFGMAGIGLTSTKYIAEFKVDHKEKINSIYTLTNVSAIIMGILITGIILICAPFLAVHSLHSIELTNSLRVGAVLLFIAVINSAQNGFLSGIEDFKSIAYNNFYGSIGESIGLLIGAYYYGVFGAILGFGLGFAILYICNRVSIKKNIIKLNLNISYQKLCKEDYRILGKFTLPAALSSSIVLPAIWISKSILVGKEGYDQLAIFEAADQWRVIILFIPTVVSQIVLPILSSITKSKENFWKVLKINLYLNLIISFVLAIIISSFSYPIMKFYGKSFVETTPLILLAFSTVGNSAALVCGLSIASKSKMWIGFIFNLLWSIEYIFFSYIFIIKGFGATALALSMLITYFIHTTCQLIYLKIKVQPKLTSN